MFLVKVAVFQSGAFIVIEYFFNLVFYKIVFELIGGICIIDNLVFEVGHLLAMSPLPFLDNLTLGHIDHQFSTPHFLDIRIMLRHQRVDVVFDPFADFHHGNRSLT